MTTLVGVEGYCECSAALAFLIACVLKPRTGSLLVLGGLSVRKGQHRLLLSLTALVPASCTVHLAFIRFALLSSPLYQCLVDPCGKLQQWIGRLSLGLARAFCRPAPSLGRTAYDLARRKGHDVVAALLREAADQQRDMVRSRTLAEGRSAAAAAAVGAAGGAAGVLAAAAAHLFSRGSDAEQQQEQREGDQGGKEAVVRKGTGVVGGVSVKGEGLVAVATATATAATVAAADPEISAVAHCEIQQVRDIEYARSPPVPLLLSAAYRF